MIAERDEISVIEIVEEHVLLYELVPFINLLSGFEFQNIIEIDFLQVRERAGSDRANRRGSLRVVIHQSDFAKRETWPDFIYLLIHEFILIRFIG